MPAASCQLAPSKTSVGTTSAGGVPAVRPPTTTILFPTTAAAPAPRAWCSSGPSTQAVWAWFRCSTRAEATPSISPPRGWKPPITHTVFWYDTIIA